MIDRTLIHVTGPAGAGKTAFIEAFLARQDEAVTCVRVNWDEVVDHPQESAPRHHPELHRYRKAGAYAAALYRTPRGDDDVETFYMTDFMQEGTAILLLEGDRPHDCIDLTIYVAPPLAPGQPLLSKTGHGLTNAQRLVMESFAHHAAATLGLPERKMLAQLTSHAKKQSRDKAPCWAIDPAYRGIERAQLVVVNVRSEIQRPDAERLLQETLRLRKDPEVFGDVLGFQGNKIPITAVAANLTDPKDPGLKKAIARVKRALVSKW
jgi:hypothetical protein